MATSIIMTSSLLLTCLALLGLLATVAQARPLPSGNRTMLNHTCIHFNFQDSWNLVFGLEVHP